MTTTAPYQPTIPPLVRTIVYVIGLVTGFASILAIGLGAIFYPDQSTQITAAAGVVGTAVGWLASALGVAYRPTANSDGIPAPMIKADATEPRTTLNPDLGAYDGELDDEQDYDGADHD